ncbi:hypothetical protein BH11ACT6_BH11ACT6_59780 [soil metagenome]
MQITARSYLTAGISLTAATALALTPIAIPANDRAVTVPQVTTADIQLVVTPSDVVAFFDNVQSEIVAFNAAVAQLALIPSQSVVQGLQSAIDLNNEIYDTLISSTDNLTLQALFETLQISADNSLRFLRNAVGYNGEVVVYSHEEIADLLSGIVTGTMSNVLAAVVGVLNDPLTFSNYANLLNSGIASAALLGNNSGEIIRNAADIPIELAQTQLHLVANQINNAFRTVAGLVNVGTMATGSQLIQAVAVAVESVTLGPAQLVVNTPFSLAYNTIHAVDQGLNAILDGIVGYETVDGLRAPGLITIASTVLQIAITQIGLNPLDPQRYLEASGALIAGGFDSFNLTVDTVGSVARVPGTFIYNLVNPDAGTGSITFSVIRMNEIIGQSIAGVLFELGLPDDIVNMPRVIAAQINDVIAAGANLVVGGVGIADTVIDGTTNFLITVSNDIENALFGARPPQQEENFAALAAPSEESDSSPAPESSGGATVAIADETEEPIEETEEPAEGEEAPAEDEAAQEEAPADEEEAADDEPVDDEPADEPAEDDAPADDDASADSADSDEDTSASDGKKADKAKKADSASTSESSDSE